jgi:hypothetical protein
VPAKFLTLGIAVDMHGVNMALLLTMKTISLIIQM